MSLCLSVKRIPGQQVCLGVLTLWNSRNPLAVFCLTLQACRAEGRGGEEVPGCLSLTSKAKPGNSLDPFSSLGADSSALLSFRAFGRHFPPTHLPVHSVFSLLKPSIKTKLHSHYLHFSHTPSPSEFPGLSLAAESVR